MLSQEVRAPAIRPAASASRPAIVPVLATLTIVLGITVVALGATLIQPWLTTTPGETITDRAIAAWNEVNEDEIRAVYADDAFLWTNVDQRPTASGIDEIVDTARFGALKIERIGPVSEMGHLVWSASHVSSGYDVSGSDEVVVFYVEDGRITQQWVIWDELQ